VNTPSKTIMTTTITSADTVVTVDTVLQALNQLFEPSSTEQARKQANVWLETFQKTVN
jgi:hypothetical protein